MNKLLIVFSFTALGLLVGVVVTYSKPVNNVYRIYLEHQKEDVPEDYIWLQNKAVKLKSGIVGRSYNIGINTKDGNPRSELKLFVPENKDAKKIIKQFKKELADSPAKVTGSGFISKNRSYDSMVHWLIIGLFFGVLIQFFMSLNGQTQTNK